MIRCYELTRYIDESELLNQQQLFKLFKDLPFLYEGWKGLSRSLLVEADFLSSAIYSSEWLLGKAQKGADILQETAKCFCAFFVCLVGPTFFR